MNTLPTPVAPIEENASATPRRSLAWRGGLFAGAWSEVGSYHPNNEDSFRHSPKARSPRFCGVADGVGGGSHGDLASAVLLDYCAAAKCDVLRDEQVLSLWIAEADEVVRARVAERGNKPGAATFVGVWFINSWLTSLRSVRVAHVGDCRLYHLIPMGTSLRIDLITQDQTYGNMGESPPSGGSTDDPARMVGVGAAGTPPVATFALLEDEALLLCSDGLHKFLPSGTIAHLIDEGMQAGNSEEMICRTLVAAAKRAGSYDDVTALLVVRRPWLRLNFYGRFIILFILMLLALFGALQGEYANVVMVYSEIYTGFVQHYLK